VLVVAYLPTIFAASKAVQMGRHGGWFTGGSWAPRRSRSSRSCGRLSWPTPTWSWQPDAGHDEAWRARLTPGSAVLVRESAGEWVFPPDQAEQAWQSSAGGRGCGARIANRAATRPPLASPTT
jgi:hypothetical protein